MSSKTLGAARDVVVVEVAGSLFSLQDDEGLFATEDGGLVAEGSFREFPGAATVAGRLEASCSH